jgi:hypothetical protein
MALPGCAYHFLGEKNPLKELGIHRIYVSEFRNFTFRPGIEQLFTTAMVREIARARSFELVNDDKTADAVLSGSIASAESGPGAGKNFQLGPRPVSVAIEYNASVVCSVELRDRLGHPIFAQTVSGSKVHPGRAELGDAGAADPLVNDSEQRLAIQFLASQMMASVYQRMVDTF